MPYFSLVQIMISSPFHRILKVLSAGAFAMALLAPQPSSAADMPVKREMRSAWVATVWQLDWPKSKIQSPGNENQISIQKKHLNNMLDSMAVNNMTAINFQVRGRCDAFYRSSYEPWSSDLVATRGMEPGYDPLQYCIEECHKRGIECHAWLNPYRFESQIGQWSGLPGDYRSEHPDWIHDVNGASILEPAHPEVRKRICDIIREIVTNYDIDGVLFDDYFYLQGVTDQDADWYNAYVANGGTLGIDDWRRENVNMMIADVYRTIKEVKPWVRFGVSPAGVSCTDADHAAKYDIKACHVGRDWQYSGIYSDPIAWIASNNLDFISPQIYWTIGSDDDYDQLSQWWSQTAKHFGRHFYSSHSISSLTLSSKSSDSNMMYASGPNASTFEEFANEVRCNRKHSLDNAPGSIFYSVKYMYNTAPKFAHYLKNNVFNTHALVPAMTWYAPESSGIVNAVSLSGTQLSWTGGPENVRYTVYAVPSNVDVQNFTRQCEYLLGVSYTKTYNIPEAYQSGYKYAVCILDRYGYEYAPVFVGASISQLPAPTLSSPIGGSKIEVPFDFKWQDTPGATHYIVEISENADMSDMMSTTEVSGTTFSTTLLNDLPLDKTLYWRVRSCGTNAREGVSNTASFVAGRLAIDSPSDGDMNVSLSPIITWATKDRNITIEISKTRDFEENNIVHSGTSSSGSYRVPDYLLAGYTPYYVRLRYTLNGVDWMTESVMFTTAEITPNIPQITSPTQGGILYSDGNISVTPVHGLSNYTIQISASDSFIGRQSYSNQCYPTNGWYNPDKGEDIRIISKALVDGTTYYTRVRGQYRTKDGVLNTEYSPTVSFVYNSAVGSVDDISSDSKLAVLSYTDNTLTLNYSGYAQVSVNDITGRTVAILCNENVSGVSTFSLDNIPDGVYIVTLNGNESLKIFKN